MIKEKILGWLNETGFPLEMTAASAFQAAGFEVVQSAVYLDEASGKGREIDVRADDPDFFGFINISVILECKSSSNPWLVFVSNNAFSSSNRLRTLTVMSDQAYEYLRLKQAKPRTLSCSQFFHLGSRCGYSLRQAFCKGVDPAYGAAMNVVSACNAFVEKKLALDFPNYRMALPVIVVDSPIFECSQNAEGELALVEVSESKFVFTAHFPKAVTCLIHVVKREALERSAKWAKSLADALREDLESAEREFIEGA